MKWNNLKNNNCPKCNKPLAVDGSFYFCPFDEFRIGKEKFEKIVNSLYKPKQFKSEEDNMSELNNLGREEISESFLD